VSKIQIHCEKIRVAKINLPSSSFPLTSIMRSTRTERLFAAHESVQRSYQIPRSVRLRGDQKVCPLSPITLHPALASVEGKLAVWSKCHRSKSLSKFRSSLPSPLLIDLLQVKEREIELGIPRSVEQLTSAVSRVKILFGVPAIDSRQSWWFSKDSPEGWSW